MHYFKCVLLAAEGWRKTRIATLKQLISQSASSNGLYCTSYRETIRWGAPDHLCSSIRHTKGRLWSRQNLMFRKLRVAAAFVAVLEAI